MKAVIIGSQYNYTIWLENGDQVGGSFTNKHSAETFLIKMGYTL